MTACIAPKPGIKDHLVRSDPSLRINDYKQALLSWLDLDESRIAGIVFADNSGYPLDQLEALVKAHPHQRPVEFLSFDHPAPIPELNYGYNEFILVNTALAASRLAAAHPYFIKATGRYRFPSISNLLARLPDGYLVAADCKGNDLPGLKSIWLAQVALLPCQREFYLRELADLPEKMEPAPPWNRKQYIESMLFDRLLPRRHEPGIILRWPCSCDPVGIGANGDNYTAPRKRLHNLVRRLLRRVLPNLWI